MTKYQVAKEKARNEAIDWESNFDKHNYSWADLAEWQDYFRGIGKRYGLLKEFHENGIC